MRRIFRQIGLSAFVTLSALNVMAGDTSPQPRVHGDLIVPLKKTGVTNSATVPASQPLGGSNLLSMATAPAKVGDYSMVGFDRLASYNFQVDDAPFTNQPAADKANDQIPAPVKALNSQKATIKGFMLPLKVSEGAVTEFLIMKDQSMCCYGAVPKITEWVSVKMNGHGVKSIMDQPVSVIGTLHVGAMRENGYLIGIYEMDGEKLITSDN